MSSNFITRSLLKEFDQKIRPNKVLILLGARRVGKTELLRKYLETYPSGDYILFNGDDQRTIDAFADRSAENYRRIIGSQRLVVIDEAQRIPEIGLKLKLMVDEVHDLSVIATGSSVFDLEQGLGEPLVGRSNVLYLFPLAQMEFSHQENYHDTVGRLNERLIFGSYPELELYSSIDEKANYLEGLVSSYLLKDILEFEGIRKADKIINLLRLVAFQIGNEVNIEELASNLKGISRNTVEKYLDLLSKVFIIYNVRGFSRNLRKEITKSSRWYFYDNGIRNAIIQNFNAIELRGDKGALWENYLMSERIKFNAYTGEKVSSYFWRTYDQQELDLVEEQRGELRGYEFKWSQRKRLKPPGGWKNSYPEATFQVIHPKNYLEFIT